MTRLIRETLAFAAAATFVWAVCVGALVVGDLFRSLPA